MWVTLFTRELGQNTCAWWEQKVTRASDGFTFRVKPLLTGPGSPW